MEVFGNSDVRIGVLETSVMRLISARSQRYMIRMFGIVAGIGCYETGPSREGVEDGWGTKGSNTL